MKTRITTLLLPMLFLGSISYAQTYFVKPNETFEKPIMSKMMELNQKITTKQDSSTYTVECVVSKSGFGKASAYIIITETKSGNVITKSEEEKGATSAFNGYANPCMVAMEKVAKKDLANCLLKAHK